jgi:ribosomal protein S18 acetylase RimI-like enzyme
MTSRGQGGGYTVRRADLATEWETIRDLWCRNYPGVDETSARRKYNSQYIENSAGQADCLLLQEASPSGAAVGTQSLLRRRFYAFGEPFDAAVMADLAVDKEHRALGPAMHLVRACRARGQETRRLLYGFPNEKSEALYRRMGFLPLVRIQTYVQLLRADAWLQRRPGGALTRLRALLAPPGTGLLALDRLRRRLTGRWGGRFQWHEYADSEAVGVIDQAWQLADCSGLVVADRSSGPFSSRFPDGSGVRVSVAVDRRSDEPAAIVTWSAQQDAVGIRDLLVTHPLQDFLPALGSFVDLRAQEAFQRIELEFYGPDPLVAAIRRAGFWPRGGAPVYFLPLEGETAASAPARESLVQSLYLTSFDRDAP